EVVAFERDAVGGVEVGRPRERVVHPVVAAGAGHVHRRVAERPHGAAVDDGADGAVAPPDGLVLGDDAEGGDRDDGRDRRGLGGGRRVGRGGERVLGVAYGVAAGEEERGEGEGREEAVARGHDAGAGGGYGTPKKAPPPRRCK